MALLVVESALSCESNGKKTIALCILFWKQGLFLIQCPIDKFIVIFLTILCWFHLLFTVAKQGRTTSIGGFYN